jgi:hydroxymethylglutaryl-CoA synthase
MANRLLPVGIDDMAFYAPRLYLDIRDLAEKRQIAPEKLRAGLGLHKMALPDAHEDAATMAAEALLELIERNDLDPRRIGRVWMGTESALDGAKPTATYAVDMVQNRLASRYGGDSFRHCDVLDMTFACVAAADAMLATLDWVAADPSRIGVVIASDVAKYELESTGEYTQGAGAIAMLIRWHPRLLTVRRTVGVSMQSEHDFFKPRREKFTETPVFDGQFSNQCYQLRMTEALAHFRAVGEREGLLRAGQYPALSERWARMVFHLPYAWHAKRMYVEQFIEERRSKGVWAADVARYGFQTLENVRFADEKAYQKAYAAFLKSVSESALYRRFVAQKIEKSQRASSEMGNLYTASMWLALMSTLEVDLADPIKLAGKRIGFVGYGSGSKGKVFEGVVSKNWADVARHFGVFKKINERKSITYEQYERLHTYQQQQPIGPTAGQFGLQRIGTEGVTLGARYYSVL